MADWEPLLDRVHVLLDRLDVVVPSFDSEPREWSYRAYQWQQGQLQGVPSVASVKPHELLYLQQQSQALFANTASFLAHNPANNALLWGARGTGKSSLVRSLLQHFDDPQMILIEAGRDDLTQLGLLLGLLKQHPKRFIVYIDDLSFESSDPSYKSLKACLDGSLQGQPDNVLIYATSNRRHLLPESMSDNTDVERLEHELHYSDALEEKISLSDRFGLWLPFHAFSQDQYLGVVAHFLQQHDLELDQALKVVAVRYATQRGSRSGRIANQFVRFWLAEQAQLKQENHSKAQ